MSRLVVPFDHKGVLVAQRAASCRRIRRSVSAQPLCAAPRVPYHSSAMRGRIRSQAQAARKGTESTISRISFLTLTSNPGSLT